MRVSSRLPVLLLWAALPVACADPLGPGDLVGTYALQQVAGDALPALLLANDAVTTHVLADTLRFTADGRGTGVQVVEHEPPAGGSPAGPVRWEHSFSFRIVEGRIQIAFDCPGLASCVAPPHVVARRTAGGLRADYYLEFRVPQAFARLSSSP